MEVSPSKYFTKSYLTLALLILVSLIIRLWNLHVHGLCQWDEGVYALSARWVSTLGAEGTLGSPSHGPPVYTLILATLFQIFGDSDTTVLAGSAIAGTVIVPFLYMLGKRWFSETDGLIAAAVWALLPIGVLYSRRGLTDIWFTLLFLCGLLAVSTHQFRNWRDVWVFIPAALAMLTKYHGAGVMIVAAAVALTGRFVACVDKSKTKIPSAGTLLAGFGFLTLVLFPWFLFLAIEWDLLRLIRNYGSYSGAPYPLIDRLMVLDWGTGWIFIGLSMIGVLHTSVRRRLGDIWLVHSVLFFLLVVMAYRPYPRLFLPMAALGCLLSANGIAWLAERFPTRIRLPVLITLTSIVLVSFSPGLLTVALKTCDAYEQAADFVNRYPSDIPVYVCAQQPLVYYLEKKSVSVLDREYASMAQSGEDFLLVIDHWIERYPVTREVLLNGNAEALYEKPLDLPEDVLLNSRNLDTVQRMRTGEVTNKPSLAVYLVEAGEGPLP